MLGWVIIAALIGFVYSVQWYIMDKRSRNVRGPFVWPVILNGAQAVYGQLVGEGRLHMAKRFFNEYSKPEQESWIMYLPSATFVWTIHPDNIKYITMKAENFANYKRMDTKLDSFWRCVRKLFGQGIFVADDGLWELQRKVASPMFKQHNLDNMKVVFKEKSQIVLDILGQCEKSGQTIDIQKLFMQYTLDSFGRIGFGIEINSLTDDAVMFPHHFDRAQRILSDLLFNPLLKFTKTGADFHESVKFMDDFIYKQIDGHKDGTDLMSQFINLADEDGNPYPRQWIRDILTNFVIAGRDTTALLLTWTAYALSQYPDVEKKAREEVLRVIGKDKIPNDHDLKEMHYLDNVLKETLRMYPSVPQTRYSCLKITSDLLRRVAMEDDVLPDGTHVRKGDRVGYAQYLLHRHPKYWDKPDEFLPERWDDPNLIKHAFQYVAFHSGPQQCLGRHMAHIEAKILTAMILQKFRFELVPNQNIVGFLGVVMPAENGINVTVSKV